MTARPMREITRKRLIQKALKSGEDKATAQLATQLKQRFNVLKKELRRANLRKRLVKADRDKKPLPDAVGVDWTTWITLFALGIKTALTPIAQEVYAVEQTYWLGRGAELQPLDIDDVFESYQARDGRQITRIGEETRNAVLNDIHEWFNTDEPLPDLIDRLGQYFNEARAEMIARTESMFIASQIADDAMEQLGIEEWNFDLAPEEGPYPCQICIDYAALNPHKRGDQMPPLHPNDRCGVSYVIPPNSNYQGA